MKVKLFGFLSVGAVAAGLAGCAPVMTKAQCQNTNWYQVGYQDGQRGSFQRNLKPDIKACNKYHMSVDTGKYRQGWNGGVAVFCKPTNAFNLGVAGKTFNNICPSNLVAEFNKQWKAGLVKYCTPAQGYSLGRAGKGMPTFCAPDQEPAFSHAYSQGRALYDKISQNQNDLNDVNKQITSITDQQKQLNAQITTWQNQLNSGLPKVAIAQRPATQAQIQESVINARYSISNLDQKLHGLRKSQRSYEKTLSHLKGIQTPNFG